MLRKDKSAASNIGLRLCTFGIGKISSRNFAEQSQKLKILHGNDELVNCGNFLLFHNYDKAEVTTNTMLTDIVL